MPATDPVLTITPPVPWALNCITAYLQPRYTPRTLMAINRSKSSKVWPSSVAPGRGVATPALLNITSSRPYCATAASIAACTSASEVTSQCCAYAVPASASMSRTVSFAQSSRTSATTTRAPSAAQPSAAARPTPEPALVMMTDLSCNNTREAPCGRVGRSGGDGDGRCGGLEPVEAFGVRAQD